MPHYTTFGSYTRQGIENIKESPARLDRARAALGEMGVDLKAFYLTMGRYDIVTIMEAPDDATAAKALLAIGMQGNVSTETMKAFTEEEFREIVAGLP